MGLSHSPKIVTDGLILCLDAANRKSYPGSGTTWFDLSGNAKTATLTNSPTFENLNSGIFTFNGTNNSVSLPASNQVITSTSFACFVWVKAPSTITTADQNVGGRFVSVLRAAGSSFFGLGLRGDNTDTIQIFIGNGTLFTYTSSGIVGTGFHHVGFTYTSATSKLNFYLDGIQRAEHTTAFATPSSDLATLASITTNYYACSIGNFSTYSRTLTAAEIQQNFNALRGRYGI